MAPSYLDSTAGTGSATSSWSAAKPTGTAAGHLLIALAASTGAVGSIGTPTGGATWTLLDSVSDGFAAARLFWKIAGGSEPSTYGFTQASSEFGASIVLAVTDADLSAPQHATSTAGSSTTVTTPSLTPTASDDLDVRFGVAAAAGPLGFTQPGTYSEREDTGDGIFITLATKTLSSTSATGTQNFTTSTEPINRAGLTVLVTSPGAGSGARIVVPRFAPHRAATW
jgi:hypothetical protein